MREVSNIVLDQYKKSKNSKTFNLFQQQQDIYFINFILTTHKTEKYYTKVQNTDS